MDRQEAIEFLVDHYENPRNYGTLEQADVSLSGGNPGCADIITMQAHFDESGKVDVIRWEGEGCTISRAAVSRTTVSRPAIVARSVFLTGDPAVVCIETLWVVVWVDRKTIPVIVTVVAIGEGGCASQQACKRKGESKPLHVCEMGTSKGQDQAFIPWFPA